MIVIQRYFFSFDNSRNRGCLLDDAQKLDLNSKIYKESYKKNVKTLIFVPPGGRFYKTQFMHFLLKDGAATTLVGNPQI